MTQISLHHSFQILSYDSIKLVEMLDDKIAFLEDCQDMGLAVPEFHQISSVQRLVQLRSEGTFFVEIIDYN